MTLGGQPDDLLDLATQPAASQQQAQQQQQHRKRQRRGGGPPLQVEGACIVDLASQSSCELQGSPPAAFGGSKDRPAVDGRTGGGAAAAWAAAAPAAAAGYHHNKKRLWGELAAADSDVVLVESSSTRHHQRARRTRYPPPADAAAAVAMGPTVVEILDDELPNAATLVKQQLHLQGHRVRSAAAINPAINPPMRPVSIAANPSIPGMMASPAAAAAAAAAAGGRRRAPPRAAVAVAARPAARAAPGRRRTSTSSSSSTELVDVDADAALVRKLAQEEEDRILAQRLMQEEEQQAQVSAARLSAAQRYQAETQAAAAAAAAAAAGPGSMHASRPVFRAPPPSFFPPYGYDPADTAGFQTPRRTPAAPAAAAQQQRQHARFDVSQAMAQVLLSMPMPRWSVRGGQAAGSGGAVAGGGSGARRGLPSSLVQMRDAVLGMQRAGLPPQLLFSDRDFTADDYELLCRLDETVENRKGASSGTIEGLPTQTVPSGGLPGAAAGERLSCAVCLEEFVEGSELRCLPCLHKFHKGCIDTWLRQKAACPVCNRDCS